MARCDSEKYFNEPNYRPDMTIRDMMEAGITPKPKSRDNRSLWEVLGIPEPKSASRKRENEPSEEKGDESEPKVVADASKVVPKSRPKATRTIFKLQMQPSQLWMAF